jgi:hypothetical protein
MHSKLRRILDCSERQNAGGLDRRRSTSRGHFGDMTSMIPINLKGGAGVEITSVEDRNLAGAHHLVI